MSRQTNPPGATAGVALMILLFFVMGVAGIAVLMLLLFGAVA